MAHSQQDDGEPDYEWFSVALYSFKQCADSNADANAWTYSNTDTNSDTNSNTYAIAASILRC